MPEGRTTTSSFSRPGHSNDAELLALHRHGFEKITIAAENRTSTHHAPVVTSFAGDHVSVEKGASVYLDQEETPPCRWTTVLCPSSASK